MALNWLQLTLPIFPSSLYAFYLTLHSCWTGIFVCPNPLSYLRSKPVLLLSWNTLCLPHRSEWECLNFPGSLGSRSPLRPWAPPQMAQGLTWEMAAGSSHLHHHLNCIPSPIPQQAFFTVQIGSDPHHLSFLRALISAVTLQLFTWLSHQCLSLPTEASSEIQNPYLFSSPF